ncbi:MAG TPA: phosphatidylglycerophosphatase A [Candidatus Acidoferrales bacterium]|jgi:phosphatidylglycerophosphatase A|nr:phosphatidylglycerophosphatase A [Candidatus Acidoferrales bacterium]
MNESTDSHRGTGSVAPVSDSAAAAGKSSARKPRFALFLATAGGLGYIPKAPGTFGSLAGLAIAAVPMWAFAAAVAILGGVGFRQGFDPFLCMQILVALLVAGLGVWSASKAAAFWQQKDPQRVVIDEVSGQHLTLLVGCGVPLLRGASENAWGLSDFGMITLHSALSWKYLLVGFILFRAFDIWKPFPARQAESLPGGWGIMADDWIAGIYAGIGLWIARAMGL